MKKRPETETHLWCTPCKRMHPKSEFNKDKNTPTGLTGCCREVISQRNKAHHQKNKDNINRRRRETNFKNRNGENSRKWVVRHLLYDCKSRSRKKGLVFDLSVSDLHIPDVCPIFGVGLVYGSKGKRVACSPSIDRIDSSKGYTPDNVWIICWKANNIKNEGTPAQHRAIADAVEKRLLDGQEHNGRL